MTVPPPRPAGRVSTGRDRGSGSVWLLAVGMVLVAAGMFGATLGAAQVARHQAQSAADLGALAGAAWALEGPSAACAAAAQFVARNGGRLTTCALDGLDVTVSVAVPAAPAVLPGAVATATSRAGPVRADDSRGSRWAVG